jgi:uncharacterized protein (TIGR02246 family)
LSHDRPADESAVRDIIARAERAWNEGDAAAFCADMTDDVEFVTVLGQHHQGRDTVARGHQHIFATIYKDSRTRYMIDAIRFVRPDVALTFVHAKLISRLPPAAIAYAERESRMDCEMHESRARPTIVLAKNDGRWQIVAFHNTAIAPQQTARA